MKNKEYKIIAIGRVSLENGFRIILEPAFADALDGIKGFSHMQILWWMDWFDSSEYRNITISEKPYRNGPASLGIFATRSPVRPNPIGLTNSSLISFDQSTGILEFDYLDAADGTPVLDIKPYQPATERIRYVKVPEWCSHWPQWMEDSAQFDWSSEFENAE